MKKTALLLIDIQNDYFNSFEGAKWPLKNMEQATKKTEKLLAYFRMNHLDVIHVRHEFSDNNAPFFHPGSLGAHIHSSVAPKDGESIILKHSPNSFHETHLSETLKNKSITNLVIAGAMSHMCIDSTTRAAVDMGYDCTVIHDACTTRDLEFNNNIIPADQVHNASMAALAFTYAKVITTTEFLTSEIGGVEYA
jgi:nicotinamidase-related amidase